MNVIECRDSSELACAIGVILNNRSVFSLLTCFARRDTEIIADVELNKKAYYVKASYNEHERELCIFACDDKNADATEEYLYLSEQFNAHSIAEIFDGDERTHHIRLLQYANEEYLSQEMSQSTEGILKNKTFRAYLYRFINSFQAQCLQREKAYEIMLCRNGIFAVRDIRSSDMEVLLSESEEKLFGYLCFLITAEFWQGFEELRNLHCIRKPLVIRNFLEKLDVSVDIKDLLKRTAQLNRQIIILTI